MPPDRTSSSVLITSVITFGGDYTLALRLLVCRCLSPSLIYLAIDFWSFEGRGGGFDAPIMKLNAPPLFEFVPQDEVESCAKC
jgi:hypothetical protein